jgi:tetratricopeptide (TPR) repeat protein
MDRYEEALKEFQTAEDLGASGTAFLSGRGYVYARTGRRAEATRIAGQLADRKRWESAAAIYLGLDDSERALHAIEKAIDERSFPAGPNFAGRVFDPIRTNPRYKQLLVKAGLTEKPE